MNISGSGHISAGEYNEKITINGSGTINGNIRCTALACSGSARVKGNFDCSGEIRVSGAMTVDGELVTSELVVAGSMRIGDSCTVNEKMKIAGAIKGKAFKGKNLVCAGFITAEDGIEAESIKVDGGVKCAGLLNAETVEIVMDRESCQIGSIGGSEIKIFSKHRYSKKEKPRLPLLTKLIGTGSVATVSESIEGDVIALENVKAPLVVGRVVSIGAGCDIGQVQYSEIIEIDPDAKVEKQEKV